jgi:hypothetical protein
MMECADDLLHFAASFFMMFLMFAMLAHATFGARMADFSTLGDSCTTQFQLITAGIDDYGDGSFWSISMAHTVHDLPFNSVRSSY